MSRSWIWIENYRRRIPPHFFEWFELWIHKISPVQSHLTVLNSHPSWRKSQTDPKPFGAQHSESTCTAGATRWSMELAGSRGPSWPHITQSGSTFLLGEPCNKKRRTHYRFDNSKLEGYIHDSTTCSFGTKNESNIKQHKHPITFEIVFSNHFYVVSFFLFLFSISLSLSTSLSISPPHYPLHSVEDLAHIVARRILVAQHGVCLAK